ncbi:multidrug effflux MFS transporter [Vreelandella utahensis]|uniref:multidrug effflux MFS transporter n=1 Tax=Vreelandella halophila TaxID=86177 RepID=UPI0009876424|nr:multidrug effflux MFS transporter [Halomonas utahensis]
MPHLQLAILLGMTVALGPLALDAYLPAFPRIAEDLGTANADVGLTLSAYVATLGLAQLIGGPLSDRYGRQKILFSGLAIFAGSALMVSQTGSLAEMLAWRASQGIGGALCAVSVPALVRDHADGTDSARLFGLIGLIMFVAPAAAPSIGTLLLALSGWPTIFIMLSCYAFLLAVLLHFALFRRLTPRQRDRTPVHTLVTNYLLVLKHPATMRFIALQALAFSTMLVFITNASFIYQEWFGLSSTLFSALFAANIGAMAVFSLLNRRLLLHFESAILLRIYVFIQAAAVAALVACALADAPYWAVAACIIVATGCMGALVPNNMANALEFFPKLGGTASALLGASQFTVAGLISAGSAAIAGGSLVPIVLIMAACSGGCVLLASGAPAAVRQAKEMAV